MKHETTEALLSRLAHERDILWACILNVEIGYLWQRRFFCEHQWENMGLHDDCKLCGEGRA
jgi:hypothetical protein